MSGRRLVKTALAVALACVVAASLALAATPQRGYGPIAAQASFSGTHAHVHVHATVQSPRSAHVTVGANPDQAASGHWDAVCSRAGGGSTSTGADFHGNTPLAKRIQLPHDAKTCKLSANAALAQQGKIVLALRTKPSR
jgi:hypothetical protein